MLWITMRHPCDMFPSRFAHAFFNLSELYCLLYMLGSQPLMSLERTIATLRVDTYEKHSRIISTILYMIASLLIPGGLVCYVYLGVPFTEPHLSCFTDQSKATDAIRIVNIFTVLLSLSSVVVLRILTFINTKRKARATDVELSTQYQLSENIAATWFFSWILFAQMITAVGYATAALISEFIVETFYNNDRNKRLLAKEGYYFIPLGLVVLPWLSAFLLKKIYRIRIATIESSIQRCHNATALYTVTLRKQWS